MDVWDAGEGTGKMFRQYGYQRDPPFFGSKQLKGNTSQTNLVATPSDSFCLTLGHCDVRKEGEIIGKLFPRKYVVKHCRNLTSHFLLDKCNVSANRERETKQANCINMAAVGDSHG